MEAIEKLDSVIAESKKRAIKEIAGNSAVFFSIAPHITFPNETLTPDWYKIKLSLERMKVGDSLLFSVDFFPRKNLAKAIDILFNHEGKRSEFEYKVVRKDGRAIGFKFERIFSK